MAALLAESSEAEVDPATTAHINTELKELQVLNSEAQKSFDAAAKSISSAIPHSDGSGRIPEENVTMKLRNDLMTAMQASCQEFKQASLCSQKVLELLLSRVSSTRQSRTSPRTTAGNPYGPRIKRSPDLDIWCHKPDRIFEVGDEVAALVDEHSLPNLWILASVKKYEPHRNRYTIVDEDPGDEKNANPKRKTYVLDADRVLCLPTLQQIPISKRIEFVKEESVLAIYPKTTVFYPARVISAPRKLKHPYYLLQFHDDEGYHRKVAAHHVVPLPSRYYKQQSQDFQL